jgi:hypothetical protein
VAVLLVLVILPMLVPRTLASVSRFSGMSITMVLCIAAMIVALAVAAVVQVQRLNASCCLLGGRPAGCMPNGPPLAAHLLTAGCPIAPSLRRARPRTSTSGRTLWGQARPPQWIA